MDNSGNQTVAPPQPGVAQEIPVTTDATNPPPPDNGGDQEEEYEEEESSPLKKILLIAGGILGVVAVIIIIFIIVLRLRSSQPQKITLVYWGLWEDQAIFEPVFAEFEKLHPNITIEYEQQDIKGLGNYTQRLNTRIKSGSDAPDLFRYHNSWLPEIKDSLLPLPSEVIAGTGIDTDFYPVKDPIGLSSAKVYYGIPLEVDDLSLFVNNALMKAGGYQVPTTWNDFRDTALNLTVKDGSGKILKSGAAIGTYDNVDHASDIISLLLIQNGADLTSLNGSHKQNADQALTYYTYFATSDPSNPGQDHRTWDSTMDDSTLAFAKGNVAMYFGYSWDILEIEGVNKDLDFSIYPVPHPAGGSKSTIASFWEEGVSASTKHPKEAFELLQFMAQKDSLEQIFKNQSDTHAVGSPYPRISMASELKSNSLLYPFVSQLSSSTAYSTPFSSDTYDSYLDDNLNTGLQADIGKIINSGFSVDSAVDEIAGNLKNVGIGH